MHIVVSATPNTPEGKLLLRVLSEEILADCFPNCKEPTIRETPQGIIFSGELSDSGFGTGLRLMTGYLAKKGVALNDVDCLRTAMRAGWWQARSSARGN